MALPRSRWCSVRHKSSDDLHRILLKLRRQFEDQGVITQGQDALWDEIIVDLTWRSSRKRRGYRQCRCEFCLPDYWALELGEDQDELEVPY